MMGASAILKFTLADQTDHTGAVNIGPAGTNVYDNPLFVNAVNLDYHIEEESAAVDRGLPTSVEEDFDGEARWVRDAPDLGADEYPLGITKMGPETADPAELITYTIELQAVDVGLTITDVLPIYVMFTSPTNTLACRPSICKREPSSEPRNSGKDGYGNNEYVYYDKVQKGAFMGVVHAW